MSKRNYITGRFCYRTDIGLVRLNNEDQAYASINAKGNILLFVCDGMGGANKGDYASALASKILADEFASHGSFKSKFGARRWLGKSLHYANSEVFKEACKNPDYQGMGTTVSVAMIVDNFLVVGQIGDSRVYRVSNNKLEQLTDDQTYVAHLYRTGRITKEEMETHQQRHVLMNALGIYPSISVDVKVFDYNNETLLLCSDGLYNNVKEELIETIVNGNDSPEEKVTELIRLGNDNGGSDNMAVVVWEADK